MRQSPMELNLLSISSHAMRLQSSCNPENPVSELTLKQISDIYSGKYSNWMEVGGDDRPIVRLSRETNSGTHVYFLETVLRLGNSDDKTLFSMDTLTAPIIGRHHC